LCADDVARADAYADGGRVRCMGMHRGGGVGGAV
jgi:hypothetical protein